MIRKIHKKGTAPDPLHGLFEAEVDGKRRVVEYEPDTDLRDTEQVPLLEEGGIEAFIRREVLPYAPDAWYDPASVKTGYEISFTRYFYKPEPMRTPGGDSGGYSGAGEGDGGAARTDPGRKPSVPARGLAMTQTSRTQRVFRKAESALLSAIEIYNKPDFKYREETFAILILNAWELLLKAKLLSDNANKPHCLYVYETRPRKDGKSSTKRYIKRNRSGNVQTLSLGGCISTLGKTAASRLTPAVTANLDALVEIRDNAIHYYNPTFQLAKQVLEIGTASVRNFIELSKRWFKHDLSRFNLYLMPIGFISGAAVATAVNVSPDEKKLVTYLTAVMADPANSTTASAGLSVALELNLSFKRTATDAIPVMTTNDPSAPKVVLTEENIRQKYPWDYRELTNRCKQRYANFSENRDYHKRRKPLVKDERFARARFLDPGNPKSARKDFYSPNVFTEFDKHYTLA